MFLHARTSPHLPFFSVHGLISYTSCVKHSPPVRLKEFPKAENELRGVKSGLLGLLTGLHKPELNVKRGKGNTQKCMVVSGNSPLCTASRETLLPHGHSDINQRQGELRNSFHTTEHWVQGIPSAWHELRACFKASVLQRKQVFFFYVYFLVMED